MSDAGASGRAALPAAVRDARIYVAGHRGLVGSAVMRALEGQGCRTLLTRTHAELELTDAHAVAQFFAAEHPEIVVLCAAKVGGIAANNAFPAEFIHENLAIQSNVIHNAWRAGVRRLVFLGSSCIYPRECPQPIREDYLLTGPLEATNRPYAVAKIAGVEMCWSYNRQYGTRYLALMPSNLYGPGDNYDLERSHVLPALIRKCHEAKVAGLAQIQAWGSGTPRREHLYSDDLGDAVLFVLALDEARLAGLFSGERAPLINVGSGEDLSIAELVARVAAVVGFEGEVVWDRSRADGTPRKLLDVSLMHGLGWRHRTPLEEGIRLAYTDFLANWAD
ncbi:MAG: NAD-dependent epimerase/dehydratase family protein [Gammaproteobacteria bacterium]|nr:GDP-L-fucose synthase [Gammaproteobacteria bacterium]NIP90379.1 GDP-L-fucose synthase [Gammaproteobacteria bacterium]NIR25007.1 GDP-L-fucose synthase [Gammaproteobacteria bacterium]NIS06708.1 GDP-L-fucose synthase [Gammaproteobacteria bacterium]NIU41338.1 NAD-dependent epimerase/dehydratase family protein [Gammaproteobacteria bacterium]